MCEAWSVAICLRRRIHALISAIGDALLSIALENWSPCRLEQMYDAQEGPDIAEDDDSDFDPRMVVTLAATDDEEEEEYGSEWEEVSCCRSVTICVLTPHRPQTLPILMRVMSVQ